MPIALSCAACGRTLSVRDELAGRSVKCPQCGEAVFVGAGPAPAKSRPVAPPPPDDDDEDDRPRPKKRKKKKAKKPAGPNPALVFGGIAFGILVVGGVAVLALFGGKPAGNAAAPASAPVVAPAPTTATATPEPPAATPAPPPKTFKNQGVRRAVDRTKHGTYLKNIALALANCRDSSGRGPKDLAELAPYYENNGAITKAITDGDLSVVWGLPGQSSDSSAIVAYETSPDGSNTRMVARASTVVERVPEADFPAALRSAK